MSHPEFLPSALFGLLVGVPAGLWVPGRAALRFVLLPLLGAASGLLGAVLAAAVLGSGLTGRHFVLAAAVCLLISGGTAVYLRSRSLPR